MTTNHLADVSPSCSFAHETHLSARLGQPPIGRALRPAPDDQTKGHPPTFRLPELPSLVRAMCLRRWIETERISCCGTRQAYSLSRTRSNKMS
jgi:hypothetical protein